MKISSGIASVQPVIVGKVEKIYIDPQEFNIDILANVKISGGNGSGAIFEPIVIKRRKELDFDARLLTSGGGLDIDFETITFIKPHNLIDGEPLIYDKNNNQEIGISSNSSPSSLNQNLT